MIIKGSTANNHFLYLQNILFSIYKAFYFPDTGFLDSELPDAGIPCTGTLDTGALSILLRNLK